MPFFKFRKKSEENSPNTPPPNSVEAIRQRARHRLIGASILVLLAVIGFPILFDSQPRPVPVDVAIEIPDKNTVAPLFKTPAPVSAQVASGVIDDASSAPAPAAPVPTSQPASVAPITPVPPASPATSGASAPVVVAAPKSAPAKTDTTPTARFVVQIGAFNDQPKAREARMKLERAGLKTYTQVIENKEGRRIRVRVGPFETKAEANKAVEKIKKLDLPANILEL
jgi:DedD protein